MCVCGGKVYTKKEKIVKKKQREGGQEKKTKKIRTGFLFHVSSKVFTMFAPKLYYEMGFQGGRRRTAGTGQCEVGRGEESLHS